MSESISCKGLIDDLAKDLSTLMLECISCKGLVDDLAKDLFSDLVSDLVGGSVPLPPAEVNNVVFGADNVIFGADNVVYSG